MKPKLMLQSKSEAELDQKGRLFKHRYYLLHSLIVYPYDFYPVEWTGKPNCINVLLKHYIKPITMFTINQSQSRRMLVVS